MAEEEIGVIDHYFSKIGVAIIELTQGELNTGDTIHIKGATTDFTQKVDSMQMEHEEIDQARKGDSVGLKVADHVRKHDKVYKVIE